ncbi:MAG: type II CAAX endopeptidase family protein [Clostridium sp.]|nr:type II CAAX endopeptidase family protein [Clostridium sp.]
MENNQRYPNLKQSIFLIIYYEIISIVPYLFVLIIGSIFNLSDEHPILNGIMQIGTLGLTLLWLKRKNRLTLSKDMFYIKGISISKFLVITFTTLGLIICLGKVDELVLKIIPMSEEVGETFTNLFSGKVSLIGSFIGAVIIAPIVEEVLCRGIILKGFLNNYSAKSAIIFSALIWGILHLNIWQFVDAFLAGIFIGWIFLKTRSILACIWVHAVNNGFAICNNYLILREGTLDFTTAGDQSIYITIVGAIILVVGAALLKKMYNQDKKDRSISMGI